MAYSAEVVKRARARLAQAKEDRESENRQHLAQAYALVPRIREIDLELRRTMAQAAQAAFLQGSDGRDLLEKVRLQNLDLQQERAILAREYFEEGFLDETPICASCGGSGYIGSAMCECLRELCRQEQKKEVSILSGSKDTFNQFRLDYYPDQMDRNLGVNIRAVMEKTFQTCRRYNDCDLLIIDDLGTEMPGQFTTAALYNLINDRLLSAKPMIVSTNLTVDEMIKRYSPQIASRLRGSFTRVAFLGEDIRVLKNRGY